ncbi:cyclopropane-fatty-acyl-phospholipid synthase [Mollisia scopiformis]|uniref:Cyclopropane-fatty-acyl-phospholipid synthase n=1 Tax=Mollisia scopiformis TaxID=149040 RepID=A0A194XT83_MOLSC|nr:cyclopropane-fatty-acyl-phospholipid synthase [Mollisia scopiformis]KUJ23259.1 cyclopropane-fatty-acyl-phospholipid synthase [Mollisia scopiformis]
MLRELECEDPVKLLFFLVANWTPLSNPVGAFILQVLPKLQRLLLNPSNTETNALHNAQSHYDTSNSLFASFLSPDMMYSCALWKSTAEGGEEESLGEAQIRKVHNILDKARIKKEHHVLDIGGGWAFLAIEAVKRTGCRVTATTLSIEQKALGEQRVKDAGLEDKIEILLADYRKTPMPEGGYDRIISIEMLEHVGKQYMDGYFAAINSMLNPTHGIMVIQGITAIHQLHNNAKSVDNFLDRYIFPGGYLASVARLLNAIEVGSKGDLEIECLQSIGPHYVRTLRSWRENFLKNWPAIREEFEESRKGKGDADGKVTEQEVEAWRRRWIYYFSYCEAAFRSGVIGDQVIVARRRPAPEEADGIPM